MDLFPNIRRHEYEFLDGGLDTALIERQVTLRSELLMLYPDLERYTRAVIGRFAKELSSGPRSASRVMNLLEPIRVTALVAVFSARKAVWREILPEQGRSGNICVKWTPPRVPTESNYPTAPETLEDFERAYPLMTALLPREDDFKGDLPIFIDYTRKEALPREQALTPDDVRHALHLALQPEFFLPFPRLARFIDERAHRAYQSFRRGGAREGVATRAYQFAQLLPTIGAGAMVNLAARAFTVAEAVDS